MDGQQFHTQSSLYTQDHAELQEKYAALQETVAEQEIAMVEMGRQLSLWVKQVPYSRKFLRKKHLIFMEVIFTFSWVFTDTRNHVLYAVYNYAYFTGLIFMVSWLSMKTSKN